MMVGLRFSALLVVTFFTACVVKPVVFEGISMLPTIADGDRMLIESNFGELKRADIIVFKYPKDTTKFYVKRIIGLPGEKVEIKEGVVFINGEPLKEEYVDQLYNQSGDTREEKIVPEGNYFVLGDNRDNSSDSRIWGTVDKNLIIGKYLSIYAKKDKK